MIGGSTSFCIKNYEWHVACLKGIRGPSWPWEASLEGLLNYPQVVKNILVLPTLLNIQALTVVVIGTYTLEH